MLSRPKPLVLRILDGVGGSQDTKYNAMAQTPCWSRLQKNFSMTLLDCSGDVVGLPEEQMESSEVSNAILYQAVDGALIKNKSMRVLGIQPPMEMTGMSLRKLD